MPQQAPDLTMVAIGGMSVEAEEAMLRLFDEEELLADLFLPTRLYPFDAGILEDSLAKTGSLLVIEEGQGFVSMSSEILAQVAERFGELSVRCAGLTADSARSLPPGRWKNNACPTPSRSCERRGNSSVNPFTEIRIPQEIVNDDVVLIAAWEAEHGAKVAPSRWLSPLKPQRLWWMSKRKQKATWRFSIPRALRFRLAR